jgi:hypothetical protein
MYNLSFVYYRDFYSGEYPTSNASFAWLEFSMDIGTDVGFTTGGELEYGTAVVFDGIDVGLLVDVIEEFTDSA